MQLLDTDQNQSILLDPTFAMVARRVSDGGWATFADMTSATHGLSWQAIAYEYLSAQSPISLHGYYLDYPLLYNNTLDTPPYNNVLPYATAVTFPFDVSAEKACVLQTDAGGNVQLTINGSADTIACNEVQGTSAVFWASSASDGLTGLCTPPPGYTLYTVNRYVF